jgi:hypothetical protein
VEDLELIVYNKRKQTIVKQTQQRRRIDLDNTIICTIEEQVLYAKKAKLTKFLSIGLVITHDTLDKEKTEAINVYNLEKNVALLELGQILQICIRFSFNFCRTCIRIGFNYV